MAAHGRTLAPFQGERHVWRRRWTYQTRFGPASQGVWQLEAGPAPTATPNPAQELLSNRSFEYTGVWRIPDTPYDAAYSQEQHYAGYWSMRTGITDPITNVRSYSDFSQDVTLPTTGTVTLRFHRWAQSAVSVARQRSKAASRATPL